MLNANGPDHENRPPDLPAGYTLNHDPDTPALLREDGSVAAVFSAHGLTERELRRTAHRDRRERDAPH